MNNQELVIRHIFQHNIIPALIGVIDPFILELQNRAVYKYNYKVNIGYDIKLPEAMLDLTLIEDIFVQSLSKVKVIHD